MEHLLSKKAVCSCYHDFNKKNIYNASYLLDEIPNSLIQQFASQRCKFFQDYPLPNTAWDGCKGSTNQFQFFLWIISSNILDIHGITTASSFCPSNKLSKVLFIPGGFLYVLPSVGPKESYLLSLATSLLWNILPTLLCLRTGISLNFQKAEKGVQQRLEPEN